jgi:hypothetical protein
MPLNSLPAMLPRPTPDAAAETRLAVPLPDLSLSSPAIAGACPAAPPSATSSAVTDAGARQAQRKARRCWPPELHRRFVAALQRLGGAQGEDYRHEISQTILMRVTSAPVSWSPC